MIQVQDPISGHEHFVAARFDETSARFRGELAPDDPRLLALLAALPPLDGLRLLDLGCGKGRFGRHLQTQGARVTALDLSAIMLENATGLDRVRGSARRLPFVANSFDAVIAVEMFEHLANEAIERVCHEASRVLTPEGVLVVIDKNLYALDADRPWLPKVVVKWIDQRRGRWMYKTGEPVRERWFAPGELERRLRQSFTNVSTEFVLSKFEQTSRVFRHVPAARLFVRWTATMVGGTA